MVATQLKVWLVDNMAAVLCVVVLQVDDKPARCARVDLCSPFWLGDVEDIESCGVEG